MKLKNVGLVAMLALVGCDQKPPAGVGVGSTEAISSTDSAEVTRSKVLEVARTHGMVQRTPLLPLIVRAINSYKAPEYALVEPAACALANGNTGSYYSTLVQLRAEPVANKAVIEGLEALFQDSAEYHALCARERINLVMMPRSGWESTSQQDMVDFAKLVYLLGDGAAEMLAPIAAELSVMNGATEAEIISALSAPLLNLIVCSWSEIRRQNST